VRVAAGGDGYLALTEGFNPGWRATVGGRPLTPIRLDGWRQGWLLPAGGEAVVDLRYAPDRWHRAGLLAGLLALLVLAALAAIPHRARPGRAGPPGAARRSAPRATVAAATVGVGALLAGAAGVVLGLVALAAPARWRAAAAAGCLAAAGVVLGFAPDWSAQPALTQLLAVTSVALAAAGLSDVDGRSLLAAVAGQPGPAPAAGQPLGQGEGGPLDGDP
jgi:arabinofuranan 3-O-arabinosyltransferase